MGLDVKSKVGEALEFQKAKNFAEAEALYEQILNEYPENLDALNLFGLLKLQNKQYDEAVFYIKKALELKPCAYFYESLGQAYFGAGNFKDAIDNYEKSLETEPNDFDVCFNLGLAYKHEKQFDKAIEAYRRASLIKPNSADVYFNMANAYENKNNTQMALKYYKIAKEHNIQYDNINYFLAVSYLKTKDFVNGWKYYEDRPSKPFGILTQEIAYKEKMKKPLWQGEDIRDKTLFVYYEAGLGDTLMYARYIPLLSKMCKKVLFKPQSDFVNLLRGSDLGAEIIDANALPIDIEFDFHIPLMSIPYVLQHNSESQIPFAEGFLLSDLKKTTEYKEKYFNNDKFKIGIKWQGNPAYDRNRIVPLESFYNLFDLKATQFYSLQKGDGQEEMSKIQGKYDLFDLGNTFNTFADTAAAIENLDLVICNDTSVAHLAAAMGKPCWILLPYVSNWRWHNDISYSPWYKSVKLFQQTTLDSWDEVFEDVYKELNLILRHRD